MPGRASARALPPPGQLHSVGGVGAGGGTVVDGGRGRRISWGLRREALAGGSTCGSGLRGRRVLARVARHRVAGGPGSPPGGWRGAILGLPPQVVRLAGPGRAAPRSRVRRVPRTCRKSGGAATGTGAPLETRRSRRAERRACGRGAGVAACRGALFSAAAGALAAGFLAPGSTGAASSSRNSVRAADRDGGDHRNRPGRGGAGAAPSPRRTSRRLPSRAPARGSSPRPRARRRA